MSYLDRIRIVVGSYDGWLYGWEKDGDDASPTLPSSSSASSSSSSAGAGAALAIKYAYEPHVGIVKSAALMTAAGGEWLATGGADETIRVYNLRRRRDMGALHSHSGAVTALEFFGRAHLLSGSDDGTLRIWRVSDWACLHVLGGHKAGVTSIAIHPTGRLALSTSSDKTVRLWNLMEGRIAYISKLSALPTPEKVQFSREGDHYALLFRNRVLAYNVASGDVIAELEHNRTRLQDFAFVGGNRIVTSADDGMLRLWSIEDEGTLLLETGCGMKDRIRAITVVQDDEEEGDESSSVTHLAIVFTSGLVQVWVYDQAVDVSNEKTRDAALTRLCSLTRVAKTGSRATCLASCFSLRPGSRAALEVAKAKGNFGKIVSGGDGGDKSRGGIENKSAKAKAKKRKRKLREEGGDAAGTSAKRVSGGKLLHDYQERQKNKKIKKKNKKDGRDGKDGGGKDSVGKKGGRNKNWKRDREMQWEKEEDERLHRKNLQQNAAKRSGGGKKGKKGGRR